VSTHGREPVVDASQRSSRAIRRIAPDGLVTTLAGDGMPGRGGVDDPRFQAGLDIAAPAGTSVLAVGEEVVTQLDGVSAFDTLNETIRVGPIAYVHPRVGRDANGHPFDDVRFVPTWDATGRLARMRVRRGARFQTGDRLGTVNAFNHSHLNVGWADEERNPLQFRLTQFRDTTPPVIARSGVRLFAEDGQRGASITGDFRSVARAIAGNVPWRSWHPRQQWHFRICNR